jgi:LysR family nitrogen assimilation transcriptional regulator
MLRSAVTHSARPAGTVTLGLPHSISAALALPLLAAAREQYPDITLQLTEELTGHLAEQLKSGRVNLAVLFDDGQLTPFSTTPLAEEVLRFICRADAPWFPGASAITLAEALGTPLILPGLQHGVRPRIEAVARAAGLATAGVIEINSIAILKSALMAQMGATILPVAPVLPEIERGQMRWIAIGEPVISRTVVLCASRSLPPTTAVTAISQLAVAVARQLCTGGTWPGATLL